MGLKIKAAVKAKSDPDFVIFARTDARQMNGLDEAIDRVNRCCDSGADIAFIEAPESRAELEEIPKRVKHPLFRQHAYRRGDADSVGEGAGATRLQDRGLSHRIDDGLRPGHARLVRGVEEHRSRGQAGYAGDEFCRR